MNEPATLKSLRDRPFELLAELERRGRAVTAAAASENPGAREWVGVAFRMAGELYLAAREETREVLAVPPGLTRVPGAIPRRAGGTVPIIAAVLGLLNMPEPMPTSRSQVADAT